MADLYSLVKKQDEKIDDLLKTAKENKDLLTGIDTRLASEPVQTEPSAPAIPEKIQVELPANIATKENVYGAVSQALKNQTDYTAQAITKVCSGFMFKSPSPSPSTPALSDEQIRKIAQEAADKAVDKRYEKLDAAADTVLHRIYNLVHGAIWAAIPKWAYTVFAIAVIAAGGFGYGFFHLLDETSKLKDVEWLYRYERGLNRDMNTVMHRERLMLHGKSHEVDSMKSLIRHHEQRTCADTTYTYYYPSNP
ncbi:hypothetical protein [Duncaniella muris]|uniref:hypothetical protein n=1 Tax=Duncaniella muris TaxID=2094150 RepID=UPI0025B67227|nr:hypothetical protein [Duncaniella muris]